jgi:hypothetical protein
VLLPSHTGEGLATRAAASLSVCFVLIKERMVTKWMPIG